MKRFFERNLLLFISMLMSVQLSAQDFGETVTIVGAKYSGTELAATSPQQKSFTHPNSCVAYQFAGCYLSKEKEARIEVHFGLLKDYVFDQAFTGNVHFKIRMKNCSNAYLSEEIESTIIINQSNPQGLYVGKVQSTGVASYEVQILGYQAPVGYSDRIDFRVDLSRDIASVGAALTANQILSPNTKQRTFVWNYLCVGYSPELMNHQFQLLRLYNTDKTKANAGNPQQITAEVDWSKSLTVETHSGQTNLTLTITEGTGYYVWRVRTIGSAYEGGSGNSKNFGGWSNTGVFQDGATVTLTSAVSPYSFYYTQFDEDINWSYNRVFVEGGNGSTEVRVSEGMTFANGLQQAKQNQMVVSSKDQVIATQTVNDFSGRPALKSMPVPLSDQSTLGYKEQLMKDKTGGEFTTEDFDANANYNNPQSNPVTIKMDGADNPFKYYSNSNFDKSIPIAEGYPYTRTLYYKDGTSRVKEQSGVGYTHSIGNDHSQQTSYASVSDDELIRIFGAEAPAGESVHKVITTDANNSSTVTYIGKDGNTIATCFSKNGVNTYGDQNATLRGLESQQQSNFSVNEVIQNKQLEGANVLLTSKTLSLTQSTEVELGYEITPKTSSDLCQTYCSSCDYVVKIMVQNQDDPQNPVYSKTFTLPNDFCTNPRTITMSLTDLPKVILSAGNYIITKRVMTSNIDPASGKLYKDKYADELRSNYEQDIYGTVTKDANGGLHYSGGELSTMYEALEKLKREEAGTSLSDFYTAAGVTNYNSLLPTLDQATTTPTVQKSFSCGTLNIPIVGCNDPCAVVDFEGYFNSYYSSVLGGNYSFKYLVPNHASITNNSNIANGVYTYGAGGFNDIIAKMKLDGYACADLWDKWKGFVLGYENLLSTTSDFNATGTIVNGLPVQKSIYLVNEFLNLMGYTISGYTTSPGTSSTAGYLSTPYKLFYYDDTNTDPKFLACESYANGTINAGNNEISVSNPVITANWNNFFTCVSSITPGTVTMDLEQHAVDLETKCKTACDGRYNDFVQNVIAELHNANKIVEGDKYYLAVDNSFSNKTTRVPDISNPLPSGYFNTLSNYTSLSDINCMAQQLVQNCKDNYCGLTVQRNGSNQITSVGTATEIANMQKAMYAPYELDFTATTCPSGSNQITDGFTAPSAPQGIWGNVLGGTGYDFLKSMIKTSDGGYLVGGSVESGQSGNKTSANVGLRDFWVVKVNSIGEIQWQASYGLSQDEQLGDLLQLSDGNFLVGGSVSSGGNWNYRLLKISASNGTVISDQTFGGAGDDFLHSIEELSGGDIILSGITNSSTFTHPSGSGSVNTDYHFNSSIPTQTDLLVVRLSGSSIVWAQCYGNLESEGASFGHNSESHGLPILKSGGNIIVGASALGNAGGNRNINTNGIYDYWVIKIDVTQGSLIWQKMHGGSGVDFIWDMTMDASGYPLLIGNSASPGGTGNKTATALGNGTGYEIWLLKVNPLTGDKIYERSYYKNQNEDVFPSITATSDGGAAFFFASAEASSVTKLSSILMEEWTEPVVYATPYYTFPIAFFENSSGEYVIGGDSRSDASLLKTQNTIGANDFWVQGFTRPNMCDFDPFCFKWSEPLVIDETAALEYKHTPYSCGHVSANKLIASIESQVSQYIDSKVEAYRTAYVDNCANLVNVNDKFSLKYNLGYYHYTLYYYNREKQLIKTVPPQGVDLLDVDQADKPCTSESATNLSRTRIPCHTFVTDYSYNSLGQLVRQHTPDGGESTFYYDNLGRLRFSQNAKQKVAGAYSYTKYDNLSRINEVGQSTQNAAAASFASSANINNALFPTTGNTQVTTTVYTTPASLTLLSGKGQRFLRNRVSYVTNNEGVKTYFSYDPHGNVEWLIQDIPGLGQKTIEYTYDLISNKVLKVVYNEGFVDQFFHRYKYDEDNRITSVETSTDGKVWQQDDTYSYYLHGPLKREEMGHYKVQGKDYSYTINGWLKSINHTAGNDPGKDGFTGYGNEKTAKDAFGMQLNYFMGDFVKEGSQFNNFTADPASPISTLNPLKSLYNGNIATWTWQAPDVTDRTQMAANSGYTFEYDELNRITASNFNEATSGVLAPNANKYNTTYSYDANGNIKNLTRQSDAGAMDNFTYSYSPTTSYASINNQLLQVSDAVGATATGIDIEGTQTFTYDEIGQLKGNAAEQILEIKWSVYNKVSEVKRTSGSQRPELKFTYDPMQNRVIKEVIPPSGYASTTYYVRDASGNVMAVYEKNTVAITGGTKTTYKLVEQPIYGSDRIGERKPDITIKEEQVVGSNTTTTLADAEERITELKNTSLQVQVSKTQLGVLQLDESGNQVKSATYIGEAGNNITLCENKQGEVQFRSFVPKKYNGATNVMVILGKDGNLMQSSTGCTGFHDGKSIAVQSPLRANEYYIISIDINGKPMYHLVDMNGNNGKGQVTKKNQLIDASVNPSAGTYYPQILSAVEDHSGHYATRLFMIRNTISGANAVSQLVAIELSGAGFSSPVVLKSWSAIPGYGVISSGEMQISPDGKELSLLYNKPSTNGYPNYTLQIHSLNSYFGVQDKSNKSFSTTVLTSMDYTRGGNNLYLSGESFNPYGAPKTSYLYRYTPSSNTLTTLKNEKGSVRRNIGTSSSMRYVKSGDKVYTFIGNADATVSYTNKPQTSTIVSSLPLQAHKIYSALSATILFAMESDKKVYELKDHLGNVRVLVGDRKLLLQEAAPNFLLQSSFEGGDESIFQSNADGLYLTSSAEKVTGNNSLYLVPQPGQQYGQFGPNVRKEVKSGDQLNISCKTLWQGTTSQRGGGIVYELIDAGGTRLTYSNGDGIWNEITLSPAAGDQPNSWNTNTASWPIPTTYKNGQVYGDDAGEVVILAIYPWVANGLQPTYFDDLSVNIDYSGTQDLAIADVKSVTDYYPFGMEMPGRTYQSSESSVGFNGMRKDNELYASDGSSYDFGARMYNSRLCIWATTDPLEKDYKFINPYNFARNNPIVFVDPDGKKIIIYYEGGTYTYGSKDPVPDNAFVKATIASLEQIRSAKSPTANIILDFFSVDGSSYHDMEIYEGTQSQFLGSYIQYDPLTGLIVDQTNPKTGSNKHSPSIGLIHELDHAYRQNYLMEREAQLQNKLKIMREGSEASPEAIAKVEAELTSISAKLMIYLGGDPNEEERAAKSAEREVATNLGMGTRSTYKGWIGAYVSESATSTVEDTDPCHNEAAHDAAGQSSFEKQEYDKGQSTITTGQE